MKHWVSILAIMMALKVYSFEDSRLASPLWPGTFVATSKANTEAFDIVETNDSLPNDYDRLIENDDKKTRVKTTLRSHKAWMRKLSIPKLRLPRYRVGVVHEFAFAREAMPPIYKIGEIHSYANLLHKAAKKPIHQSKYPLGKIHSFAATKEAAGVVHPFIA